MRKYRVPRHDVTQPLDPSIKLIPLTRGLNAIVDAADYEWLNQWNWFALQSQHNSYAARLDKKTSRLILMHRLIVGGNSQDIDHINRNPLDNRRSNLRPCTRAENLYNQPKHKNNSSGFKGVYWDKTHGYWKAEIRNNGPRIRLGYFRTKEAAFKAYCEACKKLHGEFGRTS